MASLPSTLMQSLPDAEIEVVSWSAATQELVLRVSKDMGNETGLLRFDGVAVVHLPPRFTVASLSESVQDDGDTKFAFEEAWGESYFVVADSISYTISANPSVQAPP